MSDAIETGKHKLAVLVNSHLAPNIKKFVETLTDDEVIGLLSSFKTMNIDLMKDLKKAAEDRKIRRSQWMEESPFDAIMEEGFKEKTKYLLVDSLNILVSPNMLVAEVQILIQRLVWQCTLCLTVYKAFRESMQTHYVLRRSKLA